MYNIAIITTHGPCPKVEYFPNWKSHVICSHQTRSLIDHAKKKIPPLWLPATLTWNGEVILQILLPNILIMNIKVTLMMMGGTGRIKHGIHLELSRTQSIATWTMKQGMIWMIPSSRSLWAPVPRSQAPCRNPKSTHQRGEIPKRREPGPP